MRQKARFSGQVEPPEEQDLPPAFMGNHKIYTREGPCALQGGSSCCGILLPAAAAPSLPAAVVGGKAALFIA